MRLIEQEFQTFVRACYSGLLPLSPEQHKQLQRAFFAGAMSAITSLLDDIRKMKDDHTDPRPLLNTIVQLSNELDGFCDEQINKMRERN